MANKKNIVEILEEIKALIKSKRIITKYGKIYNIYQCGHIVEDKNDPKEVKYFKEKNNKLRSCPICGSMFNTKYKKCGCGSEQVGHAVGESECCQYCPEERKLEFLGTNARPSNLRNGRMADPERWDCLKRNACREEYEFHDAIPCKNCKDYEKPVF